VKVMEMESTTNLFSIISIAYTRPDLRWYLRDLIYALGRHILPTCLKGIVNPAPTDHSIYFPRELARNVFIGFKVFR
jgi:hypothetical protein